VTAVWSADNGKRSRVHATSNCRWWPRTSSTRGLGGQLEYVGAAPNPQPWGAGAGDPVGGTPAMSDGVEDRTAAAAGNTVVLEPAETTPLTDLAFGKI